jgi:hypothetical protein
VVVPNNQEVLVVELEEMAAAEVVVHSLVNLEIQEHTDLEILVDLVVDTKVVAAEVLELVVLFQMPVLEDQAI